ncbi:penicillin-binding protein, putative [Cordyceps militaris CM01]|uniref:Penicillin-binding protein, putative n=1 Tax=Cordyceps militaris (strain CM01) TaxID=983644 RepID=G3JPJ4_CORMM|nr:penicillin-binding protein, putative [Cordyceps militaris CM01]EGX89804.1 penicillin-binding protein, putative [Cordyceps militaris CM01]
MVLIKAVALFAVAISFASGHGALRAETNKDKADNRGNPLTDEFGRYVKNLMDEWKVLGLSVAVIDDDQVYTQGYGLAILPDTPVKPDTLFLGGSTTKAHVGAALAHLISTGEAKAAFPQGWLTPMSFIIRDDFALQDEWATAHITLDDAASHRTGLPRHDGALIGAAEPNDTTSTHQTNKATVRNLRNLPPTAEPRVTFQYCNFMYIALSHVIETVTGSWLGDVLRRVIWQPLDMQSTFLYYGDARNSGLEIATGYFWDDEAGQYVAVETDPIQFTSGAGAIITNALDYSKWVKCLMHETAPFSAATHRDIRTARMLEVALASDAWGVSNYGLGWEITTFHGEVVYRHDGGTQVFGTNVVWMPGIKFGVVAFSNSGDTGNVVEDLFTQKLVEDRLGIPLQDRHDYNQETKQAVEQLKRDFFNATNLLYPNHGTDPPSFVVDYEVLAGTYSDPGYGAYTFTAEKATITAHAAAGKELPAQQLVATREDLLVPSRLVLRHVVGDYWVAYLVPVLGSELSRAFYAAKFIRGVDGKPSGLEVTWKEGTDRLAAIVTRFERVG